MHPILKKLGATQMAPMFDNLKSRTLSLDADGLLYEACHNAAKLETAIRRAKVRILEVQFLTKCQFVRAHLTARGSTKAGRRAIVAAAGAYQSNRTGPKPPLLEPLREALAGPNVFDEDDGVTVYLWRDREADDAMMQDAYTIPDVLVYSPDKDLRIVPCEWWDVQAGRSSKIADRYGWAKYDEAEEKCVGRGTAFFWAQMLMGDTADGVKGLRHIVTQSPTYRPLRYAAPDCVVCAGTGYTGHRRGTPKCECLRARYNGDVGPAKAGEVISLAKTEDDAANAVLDLYRAIDQNPLPEAALMWLLRTPDDTAEGYIWSLGLSEANRAFVLDCFNNRPYRRPAMEEDECVEHPDI